MIDRPTIERYAEQHTTPLAMLVAMQRPPRVLEIGTSTGYSALNVAEAVPAECRVVTLEADAHHAAPARRHVTASPYADRIEVCEGSAVEASKTHVAGRADLVHGVLTVRSGLSLTRRVAS